MHARVAQLVPGLARHVDVEVPRHLRVLVRVARHQLGRAQLGVHQAVEEVALLLGLDRDVVLVGPFTYSSRTRYGSPSGVTSTNSSRAGSSSGGSIAQLRAARAGRSAARRGRRRAAIGASPAAELGDVPLLALGELAQQAQRRLVGDRVERARGGRSSAAISAGFASP